MQTASRVSEQRQRWTILVALAVVSALAWVYTAYLLSTTQAMTMMMPAMPQMRPWGGPEITLTFAMWAVMMVAMMLPTVAPAALLFAAIVETGRGPVSPGSVGRVRLTAFLLGYLAIWIGFAALATAGQWGLHTLSLAPGLLSAGPVLGGALLVGAGLFQWTPLKHACLARCRSPQSFFITEWRDGLSGAWQMGLKHGLFCVGCCWLLMSLLFLTGAMNLLWMAALTVFVLVEKVAPLGEWLSRAAGVLLVASGLWLIVGTFILLPR
jgi:predicted metal-binding membrane protein